MQGSLVDYWYLIPITATFAYAGGHTRDRWAPATCILLLLLVTPFSPPRSEGIDAITITQLVDVVLISVLIVRERREARPPETAEPPLLIGIYPVLGGVLAGAVLLDLFGCRVGLVFYIPTAFWTAMTMFLSASTIHRKGQRPFRPSLTRWALFLSGVIGGTSAFGLPALRLLRAGESGTSQPSPNRSSMTSLKAFGVVTGSAFVMNSIVAYHLVGAAAFALPVLWPVLVGVLTGTFIRFRLRVGVTTGIWDMAYGVTVGVFGAASIYYLAFRVGLP